jgi:trafficking protein particle complex subunit 2
MVSIISSKSLEPIYELEVPGRREDAARQAQFVLHASLDQVDLAVWNNPAVYLKIVDRVSEQMVSAHVTHSGSRILVLHDQRNEEGIRIFCSEVAELLAKLQLNPFYVIGSRIENRDFDTRVRLLARRHLGIQGI